MDITIYPTKLSGHIHAIPSKSQAHRLLICAAFSDVVTELECPRTNADIEATVGCLNSLGAAITRTEHGYRVRPIQTFPKFAQLDCGESGSTLRFILPIVCAMGVNATLHMSGRLPQRPLSPLWEELTRMGCTLSRPQPDIIHVSGKLRCGEYSIAGDVSSQFISGLLFALAILVGQSHINIIGTLESKPYVDMTLCALDRFGVRVNNYSLRGQTPFHSPGKIRVEGDWSNAAFFLTAAALGNDIRITNLDEDSCQGDRAIAAILKETNNSPTICAKDIPDLVPILAVFFAANSGASFTDVARLRLKESDRVATVMDLLASLGVQSEVNGTTLHVFSGKFSSGVVDACNDHRIAMTAAIAATIASGPVTILGAECIAKSYPAFWEEYKQLGGSYEQYVR